ncbi:peptidyl-prolyl cis-trans isomerase [uncultured Marinobacter sp.]|uniref:peptidylprolyl isomerase n=1 Tax=uncultured Marinobacter sp. TaxID=187379 RepID=UPI002622FD91|nr:peptidyl-prolyl cis-trans isomerase [uncultured Marinobacter sp.]
MGQTSQGNSGSGWRRLLREPLVHFFAAGALVFGVYWAQDEGEALVDEQQIEISENDVRQIVVAWLAQGRSPLTRDQLQSLIDQKINEEVLFREGSALGFDRNDEIIKRRVAQKMDFLAADVAALQEPDKAELVEWFSDNIERFSPPPRSSFRHLYFSPDRRSGNARGDAEVALDTIAGKAIDSLKVAAIADPFFLRSNYSNVTPDLVLKEFGPTFAAEIFKLEPGGWRGPIQSGYGWHLVWLDSIEPARAPSFEEVETDVRSAWRETRYKEIKRTALEEMRSRYTVVVPALDTIDMSNLFGTDQTGTNRPGAATL